MSTLISWCLDCGADAEFDYIPDGSRGAAWVGYLCRTCGAAVVVADFAAVDEPRQATAVAVA